MRPAHDEAHRPHRVDPWQHELQPRRSRTAQHCEQRLPRPSYKQGIRRQHRNRRCALLPAEGNTVGHEHVHPSFDRRAASGCGQTDRQDYTGRTPDEHERRRPCGLVPSNESRYRRNRLEAALASQMAANSRFSAQPQTFHALVEQGCAQIRSHGRARSRNVAMLATAHDGVDTGDGLFHDSELRVKTPQPAVACQLHNGPVTEERSGGAERSAGQHEPPLELGNLESRNGSR